MGKIPLGLPTKNNLLRHAPDGPPLFQYGWSQGCDTGASSYVSQFYNGTKIVKPQKDFKLAEKEPDYELGWQFGFWYCLRISEKHDGFYKDRYASI